MAESFDVLHALMTSERPLHEQAAHKVDELVQAGTFIAEVQHQYGNAVTLEPSELGDNDTGWTITGEVMEDYFEWVNAFTAVHLQHGIVFGDHEQTLYATSHAALAQFKEDHPANVWDYADI